ncbi:MAG: hypothetical protein EF813_00645 [Methanosarcinales archaeon]|nr:MAG: hypothetical protein EF813_00645 [Methanosarcinales archaeon]
MQRRTFKCRMYPTTTQTIILLHWLNVCRYLYNEMLADRKNAYDRCGIGLNYTSTGRTIKVPESRPVLTGCAGCASQTGYGFSELFQARKKRRDPGIPTDCGEFKPVKMAA